MYSFLLLLLFSFVNCRVLSLKDASPFDIFGLVWAASLKKLR
jgi:hypothetical protein